MSKKLAFVFPGQGSQKMGMLSSIAKDHCIVRDLFSEASEILAYDLWQLCQQGPQELLDQTDKTQPALLTASIALWHVWQTVSDRRPGYLAGHSLGEYSALVCAGALKFSDAVDLVSQRGKFMQQAVVSGSGAMAAILGLNDETVIESCRQVAETQVVTPVNFNSPGQVVIAGDKDAVDRASQQCKSVGAKKVMTLAVSVPSHCVLMKPAAEKLATYLNEITIQTPQIPVVQNYQAAIEENPLMIRENLIKQLYNPVLWAQSVTTMFENGVEIMLECGPGNVLCGLNKRIERGIHSLSISELSKLQDSADFLKQ